MEVRASARYIRVAPRKARLVVDIVRGMDVDKALQQLNFSPKKAAKPLMKLVQSAVANAEHNFDLKRDNLYIKQLLVNDGATLKGWTPRAFGRETQIRKRTSHFG